MEDLLGAIIQGFNANGLEGLTLEEQSQELAQLARVQANKIKAQTLLTEDKSITNSVEGNKVLENENTVN